MQRLFGMVSTSRGNDPEELVHYDVHISAVSDTYINAQVQAQYATYQKAILNWQVLSSARRGPA